MAVKYKVCAPPWLVLNRTEKGIELSSEDNAALHPPAEHESREEYDISLVFPC